MNVMVEAENIDQTLRNGFWLKKTEILRGVNLRVPAQCIFGFLGANGAGKTTLIHLMTGLRRPTAGTIRVLGHPAHSVQARARIGYMPERPYFYGHLTADALLKHYGTLSGLPRGQILDRIPIVLKQVGMTDARHVELRRYSKGMLQRVGIAQTLIHDPEFLILDEPMSGLDPFGRREIRELMISLAAEGRTLFFSSHVIPDVESICDHVALIDRGRLMAAGPISQFLGGGHVDQEKAISFEGIEIPVTSRTVDWPEFSSLTQLSVAGPAKWTATVPDQNSLDRALAKLVTRGARISEIHTFRGTLEDYFARGRK